MRLRAGLIELPPGEFMYQLKNYYFLPIGGTTERIGAAQKW